MPIFNFGGESVNSTGYSEVEWPIKACKKTLSTVLVYTGIIAAVL